MARWAYLLGASIRAVTFSLLMSIAFYRMTIGSAGTRLFEYVGF